jgi:amino acid adenylation domain-containing protein/non-ribosomal peptide synthase protein (TIGR01720 family)
MEVKIIEDTYPLSPMQQGMLFHSLYAPGSGIDIERIVCALHEEVDAPALERAWQRVIERHPVLRTSFRWQGLDQPVQEVHSHIICPLEQHDWRHLSEQEQESQLVIYLRRDRRRGFELSEAPLIRLTLFRCAEADYRLIWTFHHILLDGRSFPLLLKEVFAFYEAFCQGQDLQLERPRPYGDYIEWLQEQDLSKAETFWRQALRGFTTPTPLTVDRPSVYLSDVDEEEDYGVQQIWLSEALTSALQSLAQGNQLTLNTLLQGAWALLLSRYSGDEDVVFGATRACRRSALEGLGTESMVGLFINTLPVRVHVRPEEPVLAYLKELRAQSLAIREHEHTPLVKIQECSDVPWRMPLFESILVFENYLLNSELRALGGKWGNREFNVLGRTNYPLTLTAYAGTSLLLRLKYDRPRFEDATISRMMGHLQALLQGFVAEPEQHLSNVPLLTEAERHQLLIEWNDTKSDYPQDQCIHQCFETQAERVPDAIAVVFEDRELTYLELNRRANQLAHRLRALGVGPDMAVGICMERSLAMMVGILGVLKAGGVYVPLDPLLPKERLAFMVEDTQPPVLLSQQHLADRLTGHRAHLICVDTDWETIAKESVDNPVNGVTAENLVYVIFTSGSTGTPKGVAIEHRQLLNYLKGISERLDLPAGASFATVSTFAADLGNTAIFPALCMGGCLHIISQERASDPEALAKYFDCHPVDCLKIVPSHLAALLKGSCPERVLPRRRLVLGGEACSWDQVEKLQALAPDCSILNHYGPTETTVGAVTYRVGQDQPAGQWATLPIGRPIANTQVYILDAHLQPVPIGVPGELYVGGDGLARGYLKRTGLTAEKFIPNPFSGKPGARLYKTGDLARYLADGNIEFLGRIDRQVKIRGFRVELGEIETLLVQHPAVREGVVLAREDGPSQKRLVAYVVPDQEQTLTIGELRRSLQAKLPDYMVPSAFVMLQALPLTPNGKLDYRALPAPVPTGLEIEKAYVPPRNPVERTLADIWAGVLGLEFVGVHDNFFELGGDSILCIQIVARAHQAGLQLTPAQIFQRQTIAELAAVASKAPVIRAEQGPVVGPLPLTPIQHRFFEMGLPDPHYWNMSVLLEARRPLDPAWLQRAVRHLLDHHDALRLRFERRGSGWHQVNASPIETTPFVCLDLSELPAAEQALAMKAKAEELQASFNLSTGPLVRTALFDLGPREPNRLLIIIHHLVVDGVSWRILLEDLHTAYQQLDRRETIQLPVRTTSFKKWAQQLAEYAQSPDLLQELDYWLAESRMPISSLPVDYSESKHLNTVASASTVSVSLTVEETRALLQDVPAAYGTQINDILLTALAQAFAQWTGSRKLLFDLEGHGREEILAGTNLSRTVGWFTMIFPVLLDLSDSDDPGENIKSVKEQLRCIPSRGIGYGLLRYMREDTEITRKLCGLPQAEIKFNYLGQFDQSHMEQSSFGPVLESDLFGLAYETSGPSRGLQGSRAYLLEINGSIDKDRLQLHWTYSENIHRRTSVERLAHNFGDALRLLIDHCQSPRAGGYTPSDFPEAGLSQEELDDLLAELDGR